MPESSLPSSIPRLALVTGGSGFVGRALCRRLLRHGWRVRLASRRPQAADGDLEIAVVPSLDDHTDWAPALTGVDTVFHLAALVHVKSGAEHDYHRVNALGTEHLARAAAAAGVRRLVFVSSVKVNGDLSPYAPFRETDRPDPADAYGRSKWEAEQLLSRVTAETALEVAIVRPPLVYGPDVRANFLQLLQAVAAGWPLPLGRVDNRRSLVYVENLVDALVACAIHAEAAGKTFFVSDGQDVSTPELIRRIASFMQRPARLLPVPVWLIRGGCAVLGRSGIADRLAGSLAVDASRIRRELQWSPPYTLDQGLAETVNWFLSRRAAA